MLSADDYDAELAEGYGWINRALPAAELSEFVAALARRVAVKERVNPIGLAPIEDFRHDSDLFAEAARRPDAQSRIAAAIRHGFQTREGELALPGLLGELDARHLD